MKIAYTIGMAVVIILMLGSNAIADAYKVSSAGAAVVNGIYTYYGTYDTWKSDGQYSDRAMPVYRKTGTLYYLGYRGCLTKWVIMELPNGPDGLDPNDPYDDDLAGGWVSGYMYVNDNDTFTPPRMGWEAKHDSPVQPPIVTQYIPPTIAVNKSSLSSTSVQGTNASSQFFEVWNSGGDTLTYSISDNRTWLSCTPTSGNSTGGHDSIQVSYASAGLSAGTYSATITISDSSATNSPRTISVSLAVAEPSPAITISPGSLSNSSAQGANAPSQTFEVWNSGGGVLNYAISDNVSWLSCTPISGISTGEHDTVQVAYASAGLSTGVHSATITISSAGTATKYVIVSLNVVDQITIETQPISQTKYIQQNVTFSVAVSGPPPLSYQWKKNNTAISGATSTSYTIVNLTPGHAGDYTCVVENGLESKESDRATLEVFLNDAPVITGQNPNPLVTTRGGTFTILLDNLVVNDENDDFPNDFTLNVMGGDDYTVDGHIVILSETFEGDMLNVPVSVHDGIDASNVYTLSIAINMGEPVVANIHNAPAGVSNAVWYKLVIGGAGVAAYKYQIDDGAWSQPVDADTSLEFTLNAEGFHTLEVVGRDDAGRWQSQNRATTACWTIDTTPPGTVLYNYPTGTVGTTSIAVTVGGQDVRYYRFRLSGGAWGAILPEAQTLRISGLEEGEHILDVVGMDTAGNWASESNGGSSVTWTINTSVPTAILSNLPDKATRETSATITVRKEEGALDIDQFKYSMDQGDTWQLGSGTTIILDEDTLQEGMHQLLVNAYNAELGKWQGGGTGESLESATTYTWHIDLTPPTSSVLTAGHAFPSAASASLLWTASEDGLKNYRLYFSGSEFDAGILETTDVLYYGLKPGPEGRVESYKVEGLSPGTTYYFGVISEDEAGNFSDVSSIVAYTTADTLPQIMSVSLPDGTSAGDNSMTRPLIIKGENFVSSSGNVVRFSCPPRIFEVAGTSDNGTNMEVTVPCGTPVGIYRIKVVNANGTSHDCASTYTVLPALAQPPEVIHVMPAVIPGILDATIAITGNNFIVRDIKAESIVLVDNDGQAVPLDIFDVQHSEKITASIPAGLLEKGLYDICIVTLNGRNDVSTAKLEVVEPVDLSIPGISNLMSTQGFDMSQLGGGETTEGTLPVAVKLKTEFQSDNYALSTHGMRIEAVFEPGTRIFYDNGASPPQSYDGVINPPRQIPITSDIAEKIDKPGHAAVFQMGGTQKLMLGSGQTLFVRIDMALPSAAEPPLVYYLEADGSIQLAGVDGERNGYAISSSGGTVLAEHIGLPESGYTTYTIGLFLDHMSTFVVGVADKDSGLQSTDQPFSVGEDGESALGCFIDAVRE